MSTYQAGRRTPGIPERPAPPASILRAAKLMRVGAVLNGIFILLTVQAAGGGGRQEITDMHPEMSTDMVNTLYYARYISVLFSGLSLFGLWLWMAFAATRGRAWARSVSSVFFGMNTLLLLLVVGTSVAYGFGDLANPPAVVYVYLLLWLVGLAAVVLLWKAGSSNFFTLSKLARRAPAGYLVSPQPSA